MCLTPPPSVLVNISFYTFAVYDLGLHKMQISIIKTELARAHETETLQKEKTKRNILAHNTTTQYYHKAPTNHTEKISIQSDWILFKFMVISAMQSNNCVY